MHAAAYTRPQLLSEAIELLQAHGSDAAVLAGGTDLTVNILQQSMSPKLIVDLKQIADLPPMITELNGHLRISAACTLTEVLSDKRVQRLFPALVESCSVVGSVQIRNRATLTGNICNASPAADTVPVLVLYGAVVTIVGRDQIRRLSVVEFIQGNRKTALAHGELVIAVDLPMPAQAIASAFERLSRRRGVDLATINLCCGIDIKGRTTFVLGAAAPRPILILDSDGALLTTVEDIDIRNTMIDSMMDVAEPISDLRASADYRMAMFKVLAKRAFERAHTLSSQHATGD